MAIEKVHGQWHHEIWIADSGFKEETETQKTTVAIQEKRRK
jgi:hypothetical protein